MPATRTRSSSIRRRAAPPGSTPRGPPSASPRRRAETACSPGGRARAWCVSSPTGWPKPKPRASAAAGSGKSACSVMSPGSPTARRATCSRPSTPTSPASRVAPPRPTTAPSSSSRCEPAAAARAALLTRPETAHADRRRARARARRRRPRDRSGAGEPDRAAARPRAAGRRDGEGSAAGSATRNAERGTRTELLTIVHGDALQLDWHALIDTGSAVPRSDFRVPRFKIVGNIPYAITSPLIDKALTPPLPERIVFLVQREVADRLAARPGSRDYGALSVGVQATCRVEQLFRVKPGAFHPAPRVASALVRLTPRQDPLVSAEQLGAFRAFVTACFTRRRKQLRNVVMAATGRPAAAVLRGLQQLGLDPAARPETLHPEAFARLLRWRG